MRSYKQYLKYWCSPGYPDDPSNDPPDQEQGGCKEFQIGVYNDCRVLELFLKCPLFFLLNRKEWGKNKN